MRTGESSVGEEIRVLHVDDDPDIAELTATYLAREDERFTVETAVNASDGLELVCEAEFDCIISDYEMPGQNGVEFLKAVREADSEIPFILYTGKGSEEVAAEAISAGVTDYLQKESGTDQFTILANRVKNAVEQSQARQQVRRTRKYFGTVLQHSSDFLMVVNEDVEITYISRAVQRILGFDPEELIGADPFQFVHPEDIEKAGAAFSSILEHPDEEQSVEYRVRHNDGSWQWVEVRGRNLLDDPIIEGVLVNARDIDEERRRHERKESQRETLLELATDIAVTTGDFESAVRRVTETAADVLHVDRVNVWLFDEDGGEETLTCVDHFDRNAGEHTAGMQLKADDYPDYLEALDTHQAIDAADAQADPRTNELTEDYLEEHDIGALLDATLRSEGETIGVVCHEHLGDTREWTDDEVDFVSDIADIIHRALQNRELKAREEELTRVKRAMDEAPVGIVITDPDREDNPVTYANNHFLDLTGYAREEVLGRNCRFLQGEHTNSERVAEMREAIDAGERVSVELRNYRSDGTEFWNKVTLAPIRNEAGDIMNYVGFQEDVSARKQREIQLERERSRTDFAMRATNSYIFEIDFETGREERFGDWDTLHGVSMEDVPTTRDFINKAVHPEDRATVREAHEAFDPEPGATARFEYRTHPEHGEVRWIRAKLEVRSEPEADSLVGVGFATDVTDIKREQNRVEALFENSIDPTVFTEFEDGDPIIQEVNSAFEKTFGCDGESAIGRPIDAIVLPDDPEKEAEAQEINSRIEAGERVLTEVRRQTTEGLRDFLLQSTPLHPGESGQQTYAVYNDITERKAYERALQGLHEASEELLKAATPSEACQTTVDIASRILDYPYGSVFIWDEERERLQAEAVSEEGLEAFGQPPTFQAGEGLIGYAYESGERVILDDAQEDPRGLDSGSDVIRGYGLFPLGEHGVLVFGSPQVGAFDEREEALAGNLAAHAAIALDRINREQALIEREQMLERQNERLEQFASVISHDLRNPLNVATGRIELASEECESQHLDGVASALDRMESLIDDTLELARAGQTVGETESLELGPLVESCWRNVQTAEASLEIETEAWIRADAGRLQQLLENLLRNAVTHGGSDVTISVGDLSDGFYVEDDGPGIPEEERASVFEAGYSTGEEGTGFGLSIVNQIVVAHGWDVSITAGTGGGARFEFTGVEFE